MKIAVLLLASGMLFAGCSGGDRSYSRVEEVVTAMEDEGIDCEGLDTTTEFGRESDASVVERGLCSMGDDRVIISMFDDAAERDAWLEASALSGSVAIGDNWVAGSNSEERVEEIADALDATIAREGGT